MRTMDGSYGEGGGQVLRTSLALAAITGQSIEIMGIRAGRRKPGLRPQHLTCVRAAAKICKAKVTGAKLKSKRITFEPQSAPKAGAYTFDVAQAAKGGSAGSTGLVLQTILVPLALTEETSQVTLRGGTHVAWSPPFDYVKRVYLPALAKLGVEAKMNIKKWGWFPIGGGEVRITIKGRGPNRPLAAQDLCHRGALLRIRGLSASSNLPKHIRTRQERTVLQVLRSNGLNVRVNVVNAPSKGQGTVVFLWAEYEKTVAGFTSLGELGKPAERVAEEASLDLLSFVQSDTSLDRHLADQLVLPLALADGPSYFTTEMVTRHLLTNAWVVNQFFPGRVRVEGQEDQPGSCTFGTLEA